MSAKKQKKEVLRQISYLVVTKILTWSWSLELGSEATWLRTKKTFSKNCKKTKQNKKIKKAANMKIVHQILQIKFKRHSFYVETFSRQNFNTLKKLKTFSKIFLQSHKIGRFG